MRGIDEVSSSSESLDFELLTAEPQTARIRAQAIGRGLNYPVAWIAG